MTVSPGQPGHDRAADIILVTNYDANMCERTYQYRKCGLVAKLVIEAVCPTCGRLPFRLCEMCAGCLRDDVPSVYCTVRRPEHAIAVLGPVQPLRRLGHLP